MFNNYNNTKMDSNNTNNMPPKSKLGRGLSSLLGEKKLTIDSDLIKFDSALEKVQKINVNLLKPNKFQPRKHFNNEELVELSNSIKQYGVLEPIIVRKIKDSNIEEYEIIAGERRWRATKLAKIDTIPAIIKDFDDKDALSLAIIENIQRSDLSVIEEAEAYNFLMENFNYTQQDVANFVGKSRSHIANLVRLLTLPNEIKTLIYEKKIYIKNERAIVNSPNDIEISNIIVENNLSVRETEELVKTYNENNNKIINTKLNLPNNVNENNLSNLSSKEFVEVIKNIQSNNELETENTSNINDTIKQNKEYVKNIEKTLLDKIKLK